jgi:hypothetical protein
MAELKIEMDRTSLLDLRAFILENSQNIDIEELNDISPGFHKEPLIIALIVALGGPVVTRQVIGLIQKWIELKHEEKMMKLTLLTIGGDRPVTIEELNKI